MQTAAALNRRPAICPSANESAAGVWTPGSSERRGSSAALWDFAPLPPYLWRNRSLDSGRTGAASTAPRCAEAAAAFDQVFVGCALGD